MVAEMVCEIWLRLRQTTVNRSVIYDSKRPHGFLVFLVSPKSTSQNCFKILPRLRQDASWNPFEKAETKKKRCYLFFEGFRPPIPDCAEPTGDGRVPVSRSPAFQTSENFHVGGIKNNVSITPYKYHSFAF